MAKTNKKSKKVVKNNKSKKDKEPVKKKKKVVNEKVKSKKSKKPTKEPKKSKVSKAVDKATSKKVDGTNWDETQSSGGDFLSFKSGKYFGRIRSVISLGQVQFSFNNVLDTKATSALGLVIEVWGYKIKKGKVKITTPEPAIVNHVFKALRGNPKATYTKLLKAFNIKSNVGALQGMAVGLELFTSDKKYMYVKGGVLTPLGIAEAKATPKLTQKGFCIPNLDNMTKEALLELNPITQVKEYMLKAVNYEGTEAERLVGKIRKDKPEFAKLKGKPDDKSKGKKKKKAKLSDKEEY